MSKPAEWLVAIYANGQNDLEKSMQNLPQVIEQTPLPAIAVTLQQGYAEGSALKARRFLCGGDGFAQAEGLEDCRMADPKALYHFLRWSFSRIPARKRLIVLSGHGMSWLGILPSITPEKRWMMPLGGLARAIRQAMQDARPFGSGALHGVLFDTCYMNSLEGLFEFHHFCPGLRHVLLSYGDTPRKGLDYSRLLTLAQRHASLPVELMLSQLEAALNANAASPAFGYWLLRLSRKRLASLKGRIADYGRRMLGEGIPARLIVEDMVHLHPFRLQDQAPDRSSLSPLAAAFRQTLERNMAPLNGSDAKNPHAYLTLNASATPEDARFYEKYYTPLRFAQNNPWVELQGMKRPDSPLGADASVEWTEAAVMPGKTARAEATT